MSANLVTKLRRPLLTGITVIGESSWVLFSFFAVVALAFGLLLYLLPSVEPFLGSTVGQLLSGGVLYTLVLLVVITPIWLMRDTAYVARILAVTKLPSRAIWWLPVLFWFIYMSLSIVVSVGATFIPWIDGNQPQDTGFTNLEHVYEYVLAFVALVILPPVAEELLFRGYLFGRLREYSGFATTTIAVSIIFGIVHMQWNVGIDVAILSVFLCYLREKTGTIWASMVLHSLKNAVAYFLLFIAPLLGWQLVQ